ncbi:uncharacterized protein LOC129759844 [Uranotaenia lowii]|uniref:uncharacterized protein LOC129759844 n=1 Tax=Uranotaenia lowii TaxID=190385 RepID=UPI002479ABE4|nr:uncharacterized protein LOC129759844 [Uranotaenia lowii]
MSLIDAVDTTVHAAKQIQKDKTATLDCVANGMLVSLAKSRLDSETASRLEERLDIHRVYTWTEFKEELEKRANQLACRTDIDESKSRNTKTVAAAAITQPQRREIKTQPQSCFACNEKGHAIWHCTEFKALPVPQRWDRTKRAGRCFNCLSWGHSVQKCSSKKRCSECGEAHHTLLHPVDAVPEKKPAADPAVVASTSTEINIKGASDWYRVRCLLDSGSQVESITEAAAQTLGLPYARSDVQLVGIGGRVNASRKITTVISSRCGSFAMEVSLALVPHLLDDQPSIRLEAKDVSVPSNIELADPTFYKRRGIEIILGARVLFQILSPRQIQCTNGPNLQESALGWLVGGLVSLRSTRKAVMTVATVSTNEIQEEEDPDGKLDTLFKRFWALEEVTSAEAKSTSDQVNLCEEHFLQHTKIGADGKYIVRLPFNDKPIQLGDSYEQARRRLFSLERKLTRTPEVYEQYREFLKEYLTLNHMEVVEPKDYQKIRYFIPHSCVIKPDSSSTKLRVVFDASAKASNGHSLNDMLRSGPAIQTEQFDLLLDFRCHDKVLMADIAKMYRQVHVHETDSWYQCIAWRDNPSEAIQAYRLKTVTYGEAASSFLACRALHQVGEEIRSHQPSIADIIQKCFYVDNLMMGGNSAEGILSQRKAVEAALLQRGFPLRKWASNDASIIEDVPADDLEKEINIGNHDVIKTLGVAWSPRGDTFRFLVEDRNASKQTITKRQLASEVLRLYDPLGIMQPVIITAKILLQSLWKTKLGWEDQIPPETLHEWQQLKKTLPKLAELEFPRQAIPSNVAHLELHGFSDASIRAYGGAIYAFAIDTQGNKSMNLLCAKSRVVPMKDLTLPRKELIGAKLLAELMSRVIGIIPQHINKVHYWCDSQVVLSWIHANDQHAEVYVRNRVKIIQQLTNKMSWRYIPTDQNPADVISRGISVRKLLTTKKQLWLHATPYALEVHPEIQVCAIQQAPTIDHTLHDPDPEDYIQSYKYCNSFRRTRRHFALIQRAISNFKAKATSSINSEQLLQTMTGPLTVEELEAGLHLVIKNMQSVCLGQELKSIGLHGIPTKQGPLQHLNPMLAGGLIRVTGRLNLADLPEEQRHPIFIPREHPFARIILVHLHRSNNHAGLEIVLAEFQRSYWMKGLRKTTQSVLQKCVLCVRARPRRFEQMMGQLPRPRVNPSTAFTHTGVDLCGPFQVLPSQRAKMRLTVYACLFVCFSTKAVHIEVVEDQSTGAFLAALIRFVSVRGTPEVIYSDNGRNFVGASRELAELSKVFNSELFQNELIGIAAEEGIRFSFIPPRSPNFGGLWEANIKVAKRLFTAAARGSSFNILEIQTVFYQVSAIMNSRPLTSIFSDAGAPEPLTPGHFLIGRAMTTIPIPASHLEQQNLVMRWKRIQRQTAQFWRRWQNEYLQHLRCIFKWTKRQPNLQPGQIVLIGDDNNPVARWPMGIVTHTKPGKDGVVRVATVRTASGIYTRNVRALAPLPIDITESQVGESVEPSQFDSSEIVNQPHHEVREQGPVPENEEDPPPLAMSSNVWSDRLRSKGGRKWSG